MQISIVVASCRNSTEEGHKLSKARWAVKERLDFTGMLTYSSDNRTVYFMIDTTEERMMADRDAAYAIVEEFFK